MEFDIDAKLLTLFLDKVQGEEFNISMTPEGWRAKCPDTDQICFSDVLLKTKAFSDTQKLKEKSYLYTARRSY